MRESPVAARHTTHYYACAHVFESEIAIVVVSYRIVGLELVGTVVSEAFGNAVIMQQQLQPSASQSQLVICRSDL